MGRGTHPGRYTLSKTSKNYFPTPNEIFSLGLSPGEFAVYSYLLRCANRRTHQCWPSYKTIGAATGMSVNTVRKHICSLADKGLITRVNCDHWRRKQQNGSTQKLRRCKQENPLRDGLWTAVDTERSRVQKRQTEYDHRHPRAALCALTPPRRAVRPLGGARQGMRGEAG